MHEVRVDGKLYLPVDEIPKKINRKDFIKIVRNALVDEFGLSGNDEKYDKESRELYVLIIEDIDECPKNTPTIHQFCETLAKNLTKKA